MAVWMKNKEGQKMKNIMKHILATVLTIAALAAGQCAWATTKTVTYTMTSTETNGVSNIEAVFTRSGDDPFDATAPTTFTTTIPSSALSTSGGAGDFTLLLADGFSLQGSWATGSNVLFVGNNLFSQSTKGITYTLRCSNANYYVTHVTMAKDDGTVTIADTDYDDELNFNRPYTSANTQFGKISITYSNAPHHAPDIGSIKYNGSLGVYEINSADNLRDLSVYVNAVGNYTTGGSETEPHNCAGLTFKMTADITIPHTTAWNDDSSTEDNYTPIGRRYQDDHGELPYEVPFSGTFDGGGHTLSGIRIYKHGSDVNSSYQGIFGVVENGTVQNVTITDARITAHTAVGGIVGINEVGIVSNCHATATVSFHAIKHSAASAGGIVGFNLNNSSHTSTVSGCTSAAVFSISSDVNISTCGSFGGIVGLNSKGCTISDCTAAGVILPNLPDNAHGAGAIVGENSYGGILTDNKYHSCLVGGTFAFNIGAGTNYTSSTTYNVGDVSGISLDANRLFLYTERDNTALLDAYAATYNSDRSTAHGAAHPTVASLNVTLKGYTLHKDGSWNTIALPFDFTPYYNSPLSGATIKQLDTENTAYDSGSGVLLVAFKTVTSMDKTKPYIVKWDSGADVADPIFLNVDGSRLKNAIGSTTDGPLTIRGSSKPFTLSDGMLLDAHNEDNRGCHAAIILSAPETPSGSSFGGWFTDENCTVSPTVIPFGADGSFSLYSKVGSNTITLHLSPASSSFFGETKYVATFYSGTLTYRLPSGAKAYTASLDGTDVVFHLIGDDGSVIPHGTAVIIVADDAEVIPTKLDSTEVSAHDGNILQGSDTAVAVSGLSGTPYVLNISGGNLGFYKFIGTTIPAGKAYYIKSE